MAIVATTMAAVKLMSEGFKPDRDIVFFYSGDEETMGRGATLGASEWRNLTDAEFGLNADGGCTLFDENSSRWDAAFRWPKRPSRPIS